MENNEYQDTENNDIINEGQNLEESFSNSEDDMLDVNDDDSPIIDEEPPKKDRKRKFRFYIRLLWLLFGLAFVFTIILFTAISYGKLGYMPTFEELENPESKLATEIVSCDSVILGTYFKENRSRVSYDNLSPHLVEALIATEDIRFRSHSGIDARAIARAVKGIFGSSNSGGGSTVSQQLAKMLFPREEFSNKIKFVIRKLREWVIAVKLERSYTKDEIIAMYFNEFDFLNNAVGIKSSSRVYFKQTPDSLSLQQAAMLVGMAKNPSFYNPIRRPDTTLHRRNVVLSQMMKYNFIDSLQFDSVKQLPLGINYQKVDHKLGNATYFREYLRVYMNYKKPARERYKSVKTFLEDSADFAETPLYGWCNKNLKSDGTTYDLYKDGLKIYTTLDSRMQNYAEEAVVEHMGGYLQNAIGRELKKHKYPPFANDINKEEAESIMNTMMRRSERYRVHRASGLSRDTIKKIFNTPTEMRVFAWGGEIDTVMTPMDSINYYLHFLNAGFMSMDPHNGHIKAWVGGTNYKHFKYDHVKIGKRQVGSTIKPFLYTIAMQNGYSPCYEVPCIPTTFELDDGTTWTSENADKSPMEGKMVTLKWGLANSNNYISAHLMKLFSPRPFIEIMKSAGVTSYIDPVPSMILGTSDISVYEMVGAYGIFANKGVFQSPIFVTRIEDKYGNEIASFNSPAEDVISEETAYLMLNLLQGVVKEGSGRRLRFRYQLYNEIAGKTGTTSNYSDGWFMGVTPDLVSGVWVGGEVRSIHFDGLSLGQGANMALPIFGLYMQKVYADSLNLGITTDGFEAPLRKFNFELDCDEVSKNSPDLDLGDEDNGFF